ncbi:MAG: triose-phosphate isomerase [Bacillota bacterium]|nr:triose-phosphate isomerase [Bacillota bacterium]MDI9415021.1 triose-phosphate isomerase [Bacillota bacterium]NLD12732.1 triose-phosphate isomerase [Bacillota bacterium]HAV20720.1 triose-phosphate isomerase [Bacillota bacterium]HCD42077.1 triose-phosphate isomerase [Bacillota bacterium]
MRKRIVAGNWKMHKTVDEATALVNDLKSRVKDVSHVEIVVCPAFTALSAVADAIQGSNIRLAAQNMHWENEGAYTGEVSPVMLKDLGCTYVILGHSERRAYFGETDEIVNKKVKAALAGGLLPIICVGETLEVREEGKTEEVVTRQTKGALDGIDAAQAEGIVIAYEPVWAIGTGRTASAEEANRVIRIIRSVVAEIFDPKIAHEMRIQYGGSVKPNNAGELFSQSDIDGALVGGASLSASDFAAIVKA